MYGLGVSNSWLLGHLQAKEQCCVDPTLIMRAVLLWSTGGMQLLRATQRAPDLVVCQVMSTIHTTGLVQWRYVQYIARLNLASHGQEKPSNLLLAFKSPV